MVPPLAMIAVVLLGLSWGAGFLHWLGVSASAAGAAGRLKPWLVPYALIGGGAIALVIFGRRLRPRVRARLLGGFIAVDLVAFTLVAVVAAFPGLGGGMNAAGGRGTADTPAPRPIAALGYPGRFAIYDPGELDAHELPVLGSPDLNAASATPSVQGYSSIVNGFYALATGSHQATGEGQNVLDPRAVGDGVLDQLNTSVLLTEPAYLVTAAGRPGPSAGPAGTGRRDIAANHRGTWYFAAPLSVSRLEVPDSDAGQDAAAGTQIGLMMPGGAIRWFRSSAPRPGLLTISLPHPVTSVGVVAQAGGEPSHLGPLSVIDSNATVFIANGQLQDALLPPRWGYAGHDGSFGVFVDHFAHGPLSLEALPGRSTAGASVRRVAGSAGEPTAAAVFSPHGVRVIRSVAAAAGWSATWHPQRGPAAALAVRRAGLVQAVNVPPGRGVVTWSYLPPWFTPGFALSLVGGALILLLVTGWVRFRVAGRRAGSWQARPLTGPADLPRPPGPALPGPARPFRPAPRGPAPPVRERTHRVAASAPSAPADRPRARAPAPTRGTRRRGAGR